MLQDFFKFLKFKSISADPACKEETLACVHYLKEKLDRMDFHTELWQTSTYPTLFASHMQAGPTKPTLLFYNHYDVQPVDPLDLWDSPPFEPSVRGGEVFARGAQDNKGQCFYVIEALRTLLEKEKRLPVNVKLCIEGDEETGSVGLAGIARSKKKELQADALLIVDLAIKSALEPAITLGTRGLVTLEVRLKGARGDLHSGEHGGVSPNPIHGLVELLSKLHDSETGTVMVPGFYDSVEEISSEEIDFSLDEQEYEKLFGTKPLGGEKQYSPLERAWVRPTLEINGIWGGYSGPGFKTVLPAEASAKISCRLVPHQDPQKIRAAVAEFLQAERPHGFQLHVELHKTGSKAMRTDAESKIATVAKQAYSEVFGTPCTCILAGGTIGIASSLVEASGAEPLFLGLGLPDDQIHAPNEHFGLDRIEKGIQIIQKILKGYH